MKSVVPLESNPDVFNEFLRKWDITDVEFTDVYGLDPDLLAFIPRPVRAVILVFPISDTYEKYRKEQDSQPQKPSVAKWSPQTIRNACGSMAILHSLANGVPKEKLGSGVGAQFISKFTSLEQSDRPAFLEQSEELEQAHGSVASSGDTEAPQADADIENHYVCLTKSEDELVELDGRRKGPVLLESQVKEEDVLSIPKTLETIKEFLNREEGNAQFAMLALVDKA